jgi:AcrR family transcriptional regulator
MARIRDEMKRQKIIETAKSLFAKKGFAACSISDIVEESGLSVGAIYTYFDGKEDIFRAIIDEGWLQFYGSLADIMKSPDTPARKLWLLIHRFIPDLLEDIDLVHLVLTEAAGLTGLREKVDVLTDLIAEHIGGLFDAGGHGSRFPRSSIRTAIIVLFLGITNTALLARTARLGVSLQEVLEFLKTTVESSLDISLGGELPV